MTIFESREKIGAGNSAMDVARTALRKGVRHVSVFCRRYQTAASVREVYYAKADGVEFYYGMRPTRITDDGVYYKKVEMDEDGNITSTSEEQFFPCTSVIIAISQGAQNRIVSTTTGLEMSSHGLLATDEHGHTTRDGIFASSDVVLGARTVVEAVKYSKQVAEEMDEYLTKRREEHKGTVETNENPKFVGYDNRALPSAGSALFLGKIFKVSLPTFFSKKVGQNSTTGPARFCRRATMLQPAISAVRL